MRRNALEKATTATGAAFAPTLSTWQDDRNLLDWLASLCQSEVMRRLALERVEDRNGIEPGARIMTTNA